MHLIMKKDGLEYKYFNHVESLIYEDSWGIGFTFRTFRSIVHVPLNYEKLLKIVYFWCKAVFPKNKSSFLKMTIQLSWPPQNLMIPQGCVKFFLSELQLVGLYTYSVSCNACKKRGVFNLLACFTLLRDLMTTTDCEWKIKTVNQNNTNTEWTDKI